MFRSWDIFVYVVRRARRRPRPRRDRAARRPCTGRACAHGAGPRWLRRPSVASRRACGRRRRLRDGVVLGLRALAQPEPEAHGRLAQRRGRVRLQRPSDDRRVAVPELGRWRLHARDLRVADDREALSTLPRAVASSSVNAAATAMYLMAVMRAPRSCCSRSSSNEHRARRAPPSGRASGRGPDAVEPTCRLAAHHAHLGDELQRMRSERGRPAGGRQDDGLRDGGPCDDGARRDGARRDGPCRDGSRRDGPRRDGPRRRWACDCRRRRWRPRDRRRDGRSRPYRDARCEAWGTAERHVRRMS